MVKFELKATSGIVRAGVIKEAGSSIPTPIRVLNSNELEHSKKIGTSKLALPLLPHPVFEITKYLWPDTITTIIRNGAASSGLQNQIDEISSNAGRRITLFHPIFDRSLAMDERISDVLIEMQLQIDLDRIAIFDRYNSNLNQFEERLRKSVKVIENADTAVEPMLILRMDTDERLFAAKLKLLSKFGINTLNLIYASIRENLQNYRNISRVLNDKDIWIHMSELNKKICNNSSLVQIMPVLGIDSYAMKSRPIPIGKFEKKLRLLKRFDAGTFGLLTPNEHKKLYGEDLNCNCFVDDDRNLKEFVETFQGAELLKSALMCHETCASFEEFQQSRPRIIKNDYYDYLRQKKYAYTPLKKLLKIDLNNKSLN